MKVVASGAELAALPAVMKNLKIELGGKVLTKVQQNVQANYPARVRSLRRPEGPACGER